jgi:hypothetical protein
VSGECGTHARGKKSLQGIVGRPEGKKQLGRIRHRWENGIRVGRREIGWGCGMDSIGSS